MKALYLTKHFTEPETIDLPVVDRPKPHPKSGECLVQIYSSGVNPSDGIGTLGSFPHAKLPRIPGRDFAGIVVEGKHIGKKVWGTSGPAGINRDGTHAEFIVLPESALAEIPQNLTLPQAGIQPLPFATAFYSLVSRGRMKAGDSVLVIGALGQVGHAAMSICQWKKCNPVALVRDVKKAKDLGWEAYDSVPNKSFDLVLNMVGNIYWEKLIPSLAQFGRIVIIGAQEGKRDAQINLFNLYRGNQEIIGINTIDLDFADNAPMLNEMKGGFESGALHPLTLETAYSLEEASTAYKKVLLKSEGKRICLKIHE